MAHCDNVEVDAENKKRKFEEDSDLESIDDSAFKGFEILKILREDARHKMITVHGKFTGKDDDAVILLENKPFDKENLGLLLSEKTTTIATLQNDIYSTHTAFPQPTLSGFRATMIYPATAKHIEKYSEQELFVVRETRDLYQSVTLSSIKSSNFSIQWVYNILQKKTEADRIVFEDPDPVDGFILLPDMKWDGVNEDSLYLVAIVHRHGILSLRDLTADHLPLLKNIFRAGSEAIEKKYNIPCCKLRVYLHYQPSYYHLHVHFTHIKFEAPGGEIMRAHLLEDVIENIERDDQYYQQKTLIFTVRTNDQLFRSYQAVGHFEN